MVTDVQTPFLGTPLAPLNIESIPLIWAASGSGQQTREEGSAVLSWHQYRFGSTCTCNGYIFRQAASFAQHWLVGDTHAYMRTCIHAYAHIYIHTCMQYIHIEAMLYSCASHRYNAICLYLTWGSQGMRVLSSNWFDCVLLPILCMLRPSCWPMFQPPSFWTPLVPRRQNGRRESREPGFW